MWIPGKGTGLQNFQKFRVRVWKCYRSHRSSGLCGTGVQNSQKFRAGTKCLCPYPGYCGMGRTELTEIPGCLYESLTELSEVPGTGMKVLQNFQKLRVLWHGRTELTEVPGRYYNAEYPYPGYLWHRSTELTEVPGTGMNVVQNLLTEVPGTGNTQVSTRYGVRFEVVEDFPICMVCSHSGPASPRQFVVALRAIDNHHRDDKPLTSTSVYRCNSCAHVHCSVPDHTMAYPGRGASKKKWRSQAQFSSISQVPPQRSEDTENTERNSEICIIPTRKNIDDTRNILRSTWFSR